MRLIKLEIKNLASLDREGGEVINFEEGALKDSTIFSIVGPTGSGKSTILDAICLALYNRAPRYPRKKGDRNQNIEIFGDPDEGEKNRLAPTDCRNILTHGKKEGYSKLTFIANNGSIYRAEWTIQKKTKNYDNQKTFLYKLITKNGKPEEENADWNSLPQIIGLEYEQFLRTVLIAQGSFANFLTAKEDERYELLEKLIGCEELYKTIASQIKSQKDLAVKAFDTINANFSAYEKDIISDEELEPLQKSIEELEKEEKNVKEKLEKINKDLGWFTDEAKYMKNIESYEDVYKRSKEALDQAKADFDRLKLHDSTLQAITYYKEIQEATEIINTHNNALTSLNTAITKKTAEIQQEDENLKILTDSETEANKMFDEQKPHINKARTIKGELEAARRIVKEKETAENDSEEAYKNAKKAVGLNLESIKQYTKKVEEAQKAYTKLLDEIEKEKQRLAEKVKQATDTFNVESKKTEGVDATKVQDAKSAAEQKQRDLKDAIRIQKEITSKNTTLSKNENKRNQLTKRNNEIVEELKKLQIEELTTELETLRKTHTLMTSEDWVLHRSHLEKDKPCPLCGATEHPYKSETVLTPVVNDLYKMIKDKEATLQIQKEFQKKLSQEQGEIRGKLQGIENSDNSLKDELNKLRGEWENVCRKYPIWMEDVGMLEGLQSTINKDVETASDDLISYNNLVIKISGLRKEKESNEEKQRRYIERSTEQLSAAERKKTEANTQLTTEQGKTANLRSQESEKGQALVNTIKALKEAKEVVDKKAQSLKDEIGDKDPDLFERELTKAKEDASKAVKEKNEAIGTLREALKVLEGKKTITNNAIEDDNKKLKDRTDSLREWLKKFNDNNEQHLTIEDIAALYVATDNWEDIRKRQSKFNENFTTAKTTLTNEENAHNAHQQNKPTQSQEELTAKKTELENKSNSELTDKKAQMQRHETAKKQMGALFNQRQEAEKKKIEWEEISKAIGDAKGDKLRKIAQCYTLRFLIEHANYEIRKFNSRYELQQVKNSLGIRVIDHDRADDIRDTTSLSGGETFIVSLGLALGLSALSSRNISFENLFIDEGFGTLDPDTLTTVIDSLAMLQSSQGKKVGVISHTDTMSERITTQIRIIKNGNSGSSHIEIYP